MNIPLTPDERRDRLVFYPVAVAGGIFCITVLMTIAAAFGDSQAPVTRWLNRNATGLLLWETAALVLTAVLAMGIDRVRTLRRLRKEQGAMLSAPADSSPSPGDEHVG
ncbi:hypothetical protein SH661x_000444 [Planctomicrobium sp. SH661]|uniref:hypothetical protein n=1 Tax=Planctomicrobium sp. SH661 TaxID=3448124 RepID=UPI003F5B4917